MTYVHGERTWESFINKFDTKRSNISLDAIRVFTFFLNIDLNYKSITLSLCTFTLLLFLGFLGVLHFFVLYLLPYNAGLQPLFIWFYNTTLIWTMRWSWPSNTLIIWSIQLGVGLLDLKEFYAFQFLETNLHWIEIEFYSVSIIEETWNMSGTETWIWFWLTAIDSLLSPIDRWATVDSRYGMSTNWVFFSSLYLTVDRSCR